MDTCYSYDDLLQDLDTFPSVCSVGRSVFGRQLWAIRIGCGAPAVLIHAAIHAREHITAPLVVAMARAYREVYHSALPAVDFVPMVNPDGVELCQKGVTSAPFAVRNRLLSINNGDDFALWKANGAAVDLNVNFPADWGQGEQNVKTPSPANYIGPSPACAPEVQALMRLTERWRYDFTLSYHCKGEVIYYGFGELRRNHSRAAACRLGRLLGYTPTPSTSSTGGYKDWYALRYPLGTALTVEVGQDDYPHPFPYGELSNLIDRHRSVALFAARYVWKNRCNSSLCDKP